MFVCLTGDVHHRGMRTREDSLIRPQSEVDLAIEYASIAAEHGVNVTFYVTGKCAEEHPVELRRLSEFDNVEIGGHGYRAFSPLILHRLLKLFYGSYWGPDFYQKYDVKRCKEVLECLVGREVVSWRSHAFAYNGSTVKILKECGLSTWSDIRDESATLPWNEDGLTVLPVNTPLDHSMIRHGVIESAPMTMSEWYEAVVKILDDQAVRLVTILAHPSCMHIADNFDFFGKLCERIKESERKSLFARDMASYMVKPLICR